MGDARLALLSRVTRARIIDSSREFEFWRFPFESCGLRARQSPSPDERDGAPPEPPVDSQVEREWGRPAARDLPGRRAAAYSPRQPCLRRPERRLGLQKSFARALASSVSPTDVAKTGAGTPCRGSHCRFPAPAWKQVGSRAVVIATRIRLACEVLPGKRRRNQIYP